LQQYACEPDNSLKFQPLAWPAKDFEMDIAVTKNPSTAIISSLTSTSGTGAVQALGPIAFGEWGFSVVINPTGSGAGQVSGDNFQNDIRSFPSGPCTLFTPQGGCAYPAGIWLRRTGATDLSNVYVCLQ
jgi:hypothetical protein